MGNSGRSGLLSESDTPEPVGQAFYNLSPAMQVVLNENLDAGSTDLARRTGVTQRRHGLDDTWNTDRTAALLKLRSVIVVPILQGEIALGLVLVGNRGGALTPLEGFYRGRPHTAGSGQRDPSGSPSRNARPLPGKHCGAMRSCGRWSPAPAKQSKRHRMHRC